MNFSEINFQTEKIKAGYYWHSANWSNISIIFIIERKMYRDSWKKKQKLTWTMICPQLGIRSEETYSSLKQAKDSISNILRKQFFNDKLENIVITKDFGDLKLTASYRNKLITLHRNVGHENLMWFTANNNLTDLDWEIEKIDTELGCKLENIKE